MGGPRGAGWVAAGLLLGAGACYCIYRLTGGRRRGDRELGIRPSKPAEDLTVGSYDDVLNAEQLQKLLYLLESTEDPVIIERALITLGNNAAFSVNQAIIRELGGIPIVGNKINHSNQSVKEKALNALNNLSVNVENQIKIKVQVLKLLLNLSENPAMTEGLLRAQVDSSFLSLYDSHVAKEILLRVLTLFQNINNCLKIEGHLAVQPTFTEGSLFFLLHGEECAQKIRALVDHHDAEVKEKVVTIIPKV
ncbi:armadillo repeat-containing protein 10 isoform X10 [Symphalangus syndactylus]|uniref:armadillo repeat-containing protein 10 isoform X10 n=1 Tax=Symphalangus syndactylus TaxID=9590 RepID=UPI00020AC9C5|nr:armadillo repeat-containing protein 10 isoform X6 [Symphalangus syndactylus]